MISGHTKVIARLGAEALRRDIAGPGFAELGHRRADARAFLQAIDGGS
jgi:hypothetical protein